MTTETQSNGVIQIDGHIHRTNTSAKILSILGSGHEVTMWYCDDEEMRDRRDNPVQIRLREATQEEFEETRHKAIQYRVKDGEVRMEEPIGQPGIERLVSNRSWDVDKQ